MARMESVISNKKTSLHLNIKSKDLLIMFIGFFISRVSILDRLSPFGIAFLGSYLLLKNANIYLLISSILGIFTLKGFQGIDYYIAIILVYGIITKTKEGKKHTLIKSSTITALVLLLCRFSSVLISDGYYTYDLFMIIFEGILVFTMTYIFSFSLPIENIKGKNISNEKLICSFITLALVLSGFNNMELFGLSIKNIVSIVLVMYLSYTQGVLMGVSGGIILGLISYVSSPVMPFIISLLAVGGLLAGIFRDLGKAGSILGFILGNGIISFYINNLGTSFLDYRELIMSSLLFIIAIKYIDIDLQEVLVGSMKVEKDYEKKKDEIVVKKLENMEELFKSLSHVFRKAIDNEEVYSSVKIYNLIDEISNKSCSNCEGFSRCWEEKYYDTYQKIFNVIGIVESETFDIKKCIPKIEEFCSNSDHLVNNIIRYYEDLERDHIWNQRVIDQRRLLAEQLESLGEVIQEIINDVYSKPIFNDKLEDLLLKELKNERISISNLIVVEMEKGDLEILVELGDEGNSLSNIENIKRIISESLGFPLTSDFVYSDIFDNRKVLRLRRTSRFASMTKVAKESNSEDKVSGDSYTYGEVGKTAFLAISDGMGIGKKANIESSTAIELFEKLMETNINKNMIVKTINSVLRARSNDEIFTTLDLGFIDLYTGKLQILKTGAPATFIKKKDRVEVINSNSLPIGILEDVDFNIYEEELEDGDIVIMMSDGILESNKKVKNQEAWMKDVIMGIDSQNPQTITDEILKIAKFVSKGNSTDDMTVMATKIWKSV